VVCAEKPGECSCFTYADSANGSYVGLARHTTWTNDMGNRCMCATHGASDVTWK
jgi:hypothetical protein